ncbi:esterase-like activity of phytase family protein [Roseateles chitinivorans]|uniref:esterase-like activity of phytase family protein n=1 Tax=Roseateles chitinivorans TaxID=2917965 RepID=UPI003D66EDEE
MQLRLIGTWTVPPTAGGPDRALGGISGLDYDADRDTWFLLSDDRSDHAPARFYTARIAVDASAIRSVEITGTVALRRPDGSVYPSGAQADATAAAASAAADTATARGSGEVPDPEAIRIDPVDGRLVWSSEGDPTRGGDPFVRVSARDGGFVSSWSVQDNLRFDPAGRRGARPNLTIEGLAFSPDGRSLWMSMEAPLRQDGDVPSLAAGAWTRFSRVARDGRVLGQFAYPLEPIRFAPEGGGTRADNGVSELLATPSGALLVVERSGRETAGGAYRFSARIFETDATGATDLHGVEAIPRAASVPMRKRLVLDLMALGLPQVDNIEGAAWGPRLPNGHRTLMLISDDNFSPSQITQLIALEVLSE